MSKNGHFNTQNTEIFFQQLSPQEDGFLHENRHPLPSLPSRDHPETFLSNMPFIWVQASPFLGLDDALVKQIAMASLDDAMILAGGAEGRSDWRDQRQAPGGGGGGHIFDRWFFLMVPNLAVAPR